MACLLFCISCQAHIHAGPEERIVLGTQGLGDIQTADLEEKIARDLATVRNVIEGLRELEQRANDTAAAHGRIPARIYTQAENDRIRALLRSHLNYRSILLRLLGYSSAYETAPDEDLRLKSFLLAYACGLTVFRGGIGSCATDSSRGFGNMRHCLWEAHRTSSIEV